MAVVCTRHVVRTAHPAGITHAPRDLRHLRRADRRRTRATLRQALVMRDLP